MSQRADSVKIVTNSRLILYAGGGTGGHIFPSMAIHEHVEEMQPGVEAHFLISKRPLDAQIMDHHGWSYTALSVEPLPRSLVGLTRWPKFVKAWRASVAVVTRLIKQRRPHAVVAMGGFVSGAAVLAARRSQLPIAMVNLDAVPGVTNRLLARRSTQVFTAYSGGLDGRYVGLPLRRSAIGPTDPAAARRQLNLESRQPTLLVVGGSQGARSINETLLALLQKERFCQRLRTWQVLHLIGHEGSLDQIEDAYRRNGVAARVEPFLGQMGWAWSAASLALSRAGAGSVAEAWANATPTIFLPYPYHRDQHQRLNAQPLVKLGGAVIERDAIDPRRTAEAIYDAFLDLMSDSQKRLEMSRRLRETWPGNGAQAVARWLINQTVQASPE